MHLTGHINIRLMEKAAMKTTVSQCSSLVPSLTSPVAWRTYTNLRKNQLTLTGPDCCLMTLLQNTMPVW